MAKDMGETGSSWSTEWSVQASYQENRTSVIKLQRNEFCQQLHELEEDLDPRKDTAG